MVQDKPVLLSPCGQYVKTVIELGKGNTRVVYKANDLKNGRCVAWCEPKSREKKDWEKFSAAATLLESISHRNIVTFLDVWETGPGSRTPVLVTELMSCTIKQHLLQSPRGFDHQALRKWARQVLDAIRYLHLSTGVPIVHRAVRCDHVFLDAHQGDVKLGSFDIATYKDPGQYLEEVVGDPAFMSPEMAREQYTESTDIYSYGLFILEMTTLEYPYEESTISQILNYLKTETYPVALSKVRCAYTSNLIRMCLEHNLEDRLTVQQIFEHPFFQPLPTAWPQIRFHSMEREMVTVAICYSETDVKLYSFNVNTDLSGYIAAALVRGEFIKEDQLHDASTQIHKIVEKVKRQTRVKNGIPIQDFYSMQTPVTKPPKTPKAVNLTLCSFDADEHKVELELSQTRVGKIVKFQFGVMDNETEEIAQQLILSGHLMTENKENFLMQMNAIVREQRDLAKAQQQGDEEDGMDEKQDDVSPMEHTDSDVGLNLDIRRKLSRDSMIAPTTVLSPDIDSRSQHSESSIQPSSELNYHQPKAMVNGDRDTLPPLPMASPAPMVSVPRPMPSSMTSSMPSTYQQYPSTPMQPSNIMYYHPQYIPMMSGQQQIHPSQIPQVQPQIPMYPGPHQMMTAPMSYTNGHMQQWPGMRAPADLNSIRVPSSVSAQSQYSISNDRGSTPRPDIDTPPPQSFGVPDLVSPDSRSDT